MTVVIGGTVFAIRSEDAQFLSILHLQFANFVTGEQPGAIELTVELTAPSEQSADEDLQVRMADGVWLMERGDFRATYEPAARRGTVRQSANRHSIDSVIRIVQSIELASDCGFLLHAASAIRGSSAFLFSGRSGAGKTTMARLAPGDVRLLTDEISCVRKAADGFVAWGTPFAGELGISGENCVAPVRALYFLEQAKTNRVDPLPQAESLRLLMRNILFFAHDSAMVKRVFDIAHEFIRATETFRLSFERDASVWELIG